MSHEHDFSASNLESIGDLCSFLRVGRALRRLTQTEMARQLNVSFWTYYKIEHGLRPATEEERTTIEQILKLSLPSRGAPNVGQEAAADGR